MADQPTQQQILSQNIERDIRILIGDLHVQLIAARQMLELQGISTQQPAPQQTNIHPVPETKPNGRVREVQ